MENKYKLLYVDDQSPKTIKFKLENEGFIVDTDDNEKTEDLLRKMEGNYDIYLLDFKLTENKGLLDAPSFASALRVGDKSKKKCPIILITNEHNLKIFANDYTSQDLFDFVILKSIFRNNINKYCTRMKSFVDAYRTIEKRKYNVKEILEISDEKDVHMYLDYRFEKELSSDMITNDPYAYCRTISNLLIRTVGALIGEDYLAARLGVNKEQSPGDWQSLKLKIEKCKYKGILSSTYDRWWMLDIMKWWEEISDEKNLRRLSARERVDILNRIYSLNLVAAEPLEFSTSSSFWTICVATKKPLDPADGYIYSRRYRYEWEEMEYVSLYGALNCPDYQKLVSPLDKQEIIDYGKNK